MDTINNFIDEYIFSDRNESKIGEYGNEVVDLLNKLIRLIIAFSIIYLTIQRLPDHGDKDHTMYFNFVLIISIFLLLIYIKQTWRDFYLSKFLKPAGYGELCAQDLDPPHDMDSATKKCETSIEGNLSILITSLYTAMRDQLKDPSKWAALIIGGLVLSQMEMSVWYACLAFLPIQAVQGAIYWITFASKYSPINFIFGKSGAPENPFIYEENKISDTDSGTGKRTELKNFNDNFYIMYIVLILLIFFTIIIRLTTDTIISCDNFIGPIPVDLLQGCNGYRFYMIFNIILFIGFSTEFIDSLQQISLDKKLLNCSTKVNKLNNPKPADEQIYTNPDGECLAPEDIIEGTPNYCDAEEQIIECDEEVKNPLKGCLINRTDYNNGFGFLKEVSDYNKTHSVGENPRKIIIKKNLLGDGYIIDSSVAATYIDIDDPECKDSIVKWLKEYEGDPNTFEKLKPAPGP
jgi:hypothetical protein